MKWVFGVFLTLYLIAFFLYLIGTFGWFGQARDPLSGVFLMPLGLPWNLIADKIVGERIATFGAAIGVLSPLVNLGILYWLWRR
jgi:hypothetical protein